MGGLINLHMARFAFWKREVLGAVITQSISIVSDVSGFKASALSQVASARYNVSYFGTKQEIKRLRAFDECLGIERR